MDTFCTPEQCSDCPGRLVCHCLRVTEDAVVAAVTRLGLKTVKEICDYTGAGDGCTACRKALRRYVEQTDYSSSASPICSVK